MKQSHFKFNKQERSGIFFLLLLVVFLQGVYFYVEARPFDGSPKFKPDTFAQIRLDSLKNTKSKDTLNLFPFNPNYITDHKGYALGLSTKELDRLFSFRKEGKFVNSAEAFQEVTQVSDSLLDIISPYFKFPDWAKEQGSRKTSFQTNAKKEPLVLNDLNTATMEDLMKIYGIGATLSKRIVKFRDRLGGFLVNEQLYDVYGLKPEVVQRTLLRYQVLHPPKVEKININTASVGELAKLAYIDFDLAQKIVSRREVKGTYVSLDELKDIASFPADKIGRIKLYLTL